MLLPRPVPHVLVPSCLFSRKQMEAVFSCLHPNRHNSSTSTLFSGRDSSGKPTAAYAKRKARGFAANSPAFSPSTKRLILTSQGFGEKDPPNTKQYRLKWLSLGSLGTLPVYGLLVFEVTFRSYKKLAISEH